MNEAKYERYCQCLSELGDEFGIDSLIPDEDALCLLQVAEDLYVELEFEEESSDVLISSEVGRITEADAKEWYPRLLQANAFWCGTGGATLGIHESTGAVILCYREPLHEMTGEQLTNLFQQFADTAESWKEQLLAPPETASTDATNDLFEIMQHRV